MYSTMSEKPRWSYRLCDGPACSPRGGIDRTLWMSQLPSKESDSDNMGAALLLS
jgi:hypothetical protein